MTPRPEEEAAAPYPLSKSWVPPDPPPTEQAGVGETQVEAKIGIPNGVVRFIIGRGGMSITSMQRRTGCPLQIQKEHEMSPS